MALSCGLVGLPTVGKTTFFNLLTHVGADTSAFFTGKTDTRTGVCLIPDARIDFLSEIFKPRKTTYAQLQVVDVPGLMRGSSQGQGVGNQFLEHVREVDALVHIVRAFENPSVLHIDGSVDPLRDIQTINVELLLADLQLVETRMERIRSGKQKREQLAELKVLEKCAEAFSDEKYFREVDLGPEEKAAIAHLRFLTEKPVIIVVNIDEKQLDQNSYPQAEGVRAYAEQAGIPLLEICAQIEAEINALDPREQEEFMRSLGIKEAGIKRLAQSMYSHLGLISFLTAGEDEVRAWTIPRGTNAKRAAGKIHSDMERGFIRAEVVAFEDLKRCGSIARAREQGLVRLEGKDYIVKDGDVINFRFNV
ncbi:MAG: redox-regulated ATPase YchF [Clostridia bacterium]|nr:redox-regulated ATPase YchF [Clostridia bacterium]